MADVDTGLFEVTSPAKLENGDHVVTVYSTNPNNGSQSKPVRVAFTIIGADDGTQTAVVTSATEGETDSHTLIIVSGGIGIALVIVLALLMRKKNGNEQE